MPGLRLPDEHVKQLTNLVRTDQAQFDSLLEALTESAPSLSPSRLVKNFRKEVPGLEKRTLNEIVTTLVTLYRVKESAEVSIPEFISDVKDAMASEKALDEGEINVLDERLSRILTLERPIGVTAKAHELFVSHEHVFCETRIITDIRPVFTGDAKSEPVDAVIVHMLKIGYHADGEHSDFFVALDSNDINALREALNRAEAKAKTLRSAFERAGMTFLDVE